MLSILLLSFALWNVTHKCSFSLVLIQLSSVSNGSELGVIFSLGWFDFFGCCHPNVTSTLAFQEQPTNGSKDAAGLQTKLEIDNPGSISLFCLRKIEFGHVFRSFFTGVWLGGHQLLGLNHQSKLKGFFGNYGRTKSVTLKNCTKTLKFNDKYR